jgi:hypothetical protein
MKYSSDFLSRAHALSFENRATLSQSNLCGCFYCLKTFSPSEILEWIDDKNADTAMCPYCGIDAIIAGKSEFPIDDMEFLKQMFHRYFN